MADMCRVFGEDCIGLQGEWGCGAFDDEEGRRGCLFRPSHGVSASNIIFDHEIGENRQRGNNGGQCLFGRKVARFNQGRSITTGGDGNHEETSGADLGFKDISGFFLGSINNTMSQLHDTYLELDKIENGFDSEAMGTSDMVLKIVNMLRLTPPIPRWQCQACKGTCNILFSFKPSWRDVCKHDACVKYLGGYKGTEASPSCTLIG
ncbi:hypothetical protein BGW38_000493 [Lunasporangiospora selenospora]|uniref:SRCR domain-containing protein n=1 Tax=Lunasporangiospora selenospora TaxID=979761 RepID=A0A9P6KET2_9FUNG|nr:hypothetical protein BGW38_000493 [Lunasporangiospora selenospora]